MKYFVELRGMQNIWRFTGGGIDIFWVIQSQMCVSILWHHHAMGEGARKMFTHSWVSCNLFFECSTKDKMIAITEQFNLPLAVIVNNSIRSFSVPWIYRLKIGVQSKNRNTTHVTGRRHTPWQSEVIIDRHVVLIIYCSKSHIIPRVRCQKGQAHTRDNLINWSDLVNSHQITTLGLLPNYLRNY